ncbi:MULTISPECIES: hypothetical protein [Mesorhizobium]|uniref:hypothetical protein n=1 Tax=Mesorhizobium TaxID=68287 RepID=UPI000800B08C|nr:MULTISPECIES: hypothetical protein [Mesorhizobium]OBQ94275.1 hypothetical protein A9K66_27900 [Mesorhizobium sp. AA23]
MAAELPQRRISSIACDHETWPLRTRCSCCGCVSTIAYNAGDGDEACREHHEQHVDELGVGNELAIVARDDQGRSQIIAELAPLERDQTTEELRDALPRLSHLFGCGGGVGQAVGERDDLFTLFVRQTEQFGDHVGGQRNGELANQIGTAAALRHLGQESIDALFDPWRQQGDMTGREALGQQATQAPVIDAMRRGHVVHFAHPDQRMILGNFAVLQRPPLSPVPVETLVGKHPPERLLTTCHPGQLVAWQRHSRHPPCCRIAEDRSSSCVGATDTPITSQ